MNYTPIIQFNLPPECLNLNHTTLWKEHLSFPEALLSCDDTLPEGIAVTAAADVAGDVTALGTIKLACTYDVC